MTTKHPAPQHPAGHGLRRRAFLALPLAAAAVGTAGCGFGNGSSPQPKGGSSGSNKGPGGSKGLTTTLREAYRPVPQLNPAFSVQTPNGTYMNAMMREGLVRRDPTNSQKYLPGAAKSWDTSADGKTYTFHLQDGLKWSSGDPLTANDFVWSFQYYYSPDLAKQGNKYPVSHKGDPANTSIKGLSDYFAGKATDFSNVGIKATDDHTLEITLTDPDYKFVDSLVRTYPLQQKNVTANPKDFWSAENFVGNGPYKMTQYKQNSTAAMEANKNYWDVKGYGITTRQIQFNSSGSTGMMVSYNADEIDIFRVDGDPTALVAGRKDLQQQLKRAPFLQFKGLNVMPSSNPILQQSQKLRQALALAIDRDALAKVSPPDVAGPAWVPSGIEGADQIPKATFDPDQAKQLMQEAGHPNGKGIPTLTIFTYATMPVLEAVGSMWQKHLNIKTEVAVKEVGIYGDMIRGNLPKDKVFLAFNYQAPSPYMMMRYGSPTYFQSYYVTYEASLKYYNIMFGKDKNKYSANQQESLVAKLFDNAWLPEYKKFQQMAQSAVDAQADLTKATKLATQAAAYFQQSYLFIPMLWAGYTFMQKPRINNLTLTSYADDLFSLKGVTLNPAKS